MHRIDTPNRALNLWGAGKDGWRDGNKAAGINATELNASFMNMLQEEFAGLVEFTAQTLDPANNGQVLLAIEKLIEARSGNYALDTGAANAYVVALSPAITAYTGNFSGSFKAVNANTGASTLNAGGGAIALVNDVGGALALGDIAAGDVVAYNYIAADNKAYITSMVQSQSDARYAQLAQFIGANQSLSANGYQKLPGGLIIQWGTANSSAGNLAVTFPIAFPTACLMAIGSSNNGNSNCLISNSPPTTTGVSFYTFTANTAGVITAAIAWIAIGK